MASIIENTQEFVRSALEGNDASHDYAHIERVYNIAMNIARQEKLGEEDLQIVALAALLHDIADWKYSGSETAGVEAAEAYLGKYHRCRKRLLTEYAGLFSAFRSTTKLDEATRKLINEKDKCLCIVQDADRLDAIGAIGIARCFTYGGKKKRPLYGANTENIVRKISKDDYMKAGRNAPTIEHFYEKLLLLKDMMKTDGGKLIANKRHDFMVGFLRQFSNEINGIC